MSHKVDAGQRAIKVMPTLWARKVRKMEMEEELFDALEDFSVKESVQVNPEKEHEKTGEEVKEEVAETDDETEPSEPPSEEKKNEASTIPMAAYLDEKRKRQAYEEKLKDFEQRLAQYERPDLDEPDPSVDPEGFKEHVKKRVMAEMLANRINESRSKMLQAAPDYEDMEKTFLYLSSINPELKQKMANHADPARFAYETAIAYRESEKAKLRAELMSQEKTSEKPKVPKVPDLTKATAMGGNTSLKEEYSYEHLLDDLPY